MKGWEVNLQIFKNQKVNIFIYDDNLDVIKNDFKTKNYYKPDEKNISDFFVIFVSPGIGRNHDLIKKAIKKKIPISSDIELFWENKVTNNTYKSILGVTGTNGKSTIALMISSFKNQPLGNFGILY